MNVEKWLDTFHTAWKNHDIEKVMSLFTDNVEYWETPHYLVGSKNELRKEWAAIDSQTDIQVRSKVFSSVDNKHSIIWHLRYAKQGKTHESGGTYLIQLDTRGLCNYFHYTGEAKEKL